MLEETSKSITNDEVIDMRLALGRCRRFLEGRLLRTDLSAQEIVQTTNLSREYRTIMRSVTMLSGRIGVEILERHHGRTEVTEGILQLSMSGTSHGFTKEVLSANIEDLVLKCKSLKESG